LTLSGEAELAIETRAPNVITNLPEAKEVRELRGGVCGARPQIIRTR
jgi:hypothetical protein